MAIGDADDYDFGSPEYRALVDAKVEIIGAVGRTIGYMGDYVNETDTELDKLPYWLVLVLAEALKK